MTTAIKSAIKSIRTTGAKFDALVQSTGLDILAHIDAHGDVSLANELFAAMPKGSRTASLAGWLMAYGKLRANTGKDKAINPFRFDGNKTTDLESASATHWATFGKPEQEPDQVFDLAKALASLLRKAEQAESVSDPELLARIKVLTA